MLPGREALVSSASCSGPMRVALPLQPGRHGIRSMGLDSGAKSLARAHVCLSVHVARIRIQVMYEQPLSFRHQAHCYLNTSLTPGARQEQVFRIVAYFSGPHPASRATRCGGGPPRPAVAPCIATHTGGTSRRCTPHRPPAPPYDETSRAARRIATRAGGCLALAVVPRRRLCCRAAPHIAAHAIGKSKGKHNPRGFFWWKKTSFTHGGQTLSPDANKPSAEMAMA